MSRYCLLQDSQKSQRHTTQMYQLSSGFCSVFLVDFYVAKVICFLLAIVVVNLSFTFQRCFASVISFFEILTVFRSVSYFGPTRFKWHVCILQSRYYLGFYKNNSIFSHDQIKVPWGLQQFSMSIIRRVNCFCSVYHEIALSTLHHSHTMGFYTLLSQ